MTTYNAATKTARMTATRDEVAGGTLEILSAADAVLAVFALSAAGGTIAGDAWTLTFVSTSTTGETAAGAGTTATKAQVKNSGGDVLITGWDVGTEVTIDNASIADGQTVNIGVCTVTHAA